MKKIISLFIISVFLYSGCVFAQSHDSSLDNKSIRSLAFDDANTQGIVTIRALPGNPGNYTIYLPSANGTISLGGGGGGGTPGGSNADVQFNNSGAFGGNDDFQYTTNHMFLNDGGTNDFDIVSGGWLRLETGDNGSFPLILQNGNTKHILMGTYTDNSSGDFVQINGKVDTSSNMGIGTTDPNFALDINDATSSGIDIGDSNNSSWAISNTGHLVLQDISNGHQSFNAGGTGNETVTTNNNTLDYNGNGQMAIGLYPPVYGLDINDLAATGYDAGDSTTGNWWIKPTGDAQFKGTIVAGTGTATITGDGSGNVTFGASTITTSCSAHSGQASCWSTSGAAGYCTSVVGAGGACTCVSC